MSVMFSATRHATRKMLKPKSARPQSSRKQKAKPSVPEQPTVAAANVKKWIWEMGGEEMNVLFRKDTMEVWTNGIKTDTMSDFVDDGAMLNFVINSQKARITGQRNPATGEINYVFSVNGYEIPSVPVE